MAQRMVGVDLGASAVRVVEVSGVDRDGFAVITRLSAVDMDPDEAWVSAGKIRNPQAVAVALVKALSQAGVPKYGFVLGLTAPEVAIATTRIPSAIKPGERVQAIRALGKEVSPLVPLAAAELAVNYRQTDKTGEGTSWDMVTVAASLASDVDQLNALCKLAKVTPRAIDLSGVALMRALVRTQESSREVATVVDIGATKLTVTTREGRHVRSLRTAQFGGNDITRALQAVRGDTFTDAEMRKRNLRLTHTTTLTPTVPDMTYGDVEVDRLLDDKTKTQLEEAFNNAGDQLVDQIATSIEHDADQAGSFTEGVSLTGGGALLAGLKERLQQRLGVPVQVGRPWATIAPHKRNAAYKLDGKDDPLLMQQLGPAIGLALWKERG